jgi:hypothetical protein
MNSGRNANYVNSNKNSNRSKEDSERMSLSRTNQRYCIDSILESKGNTDKDCDKNNINSNSNNNTHCTDLNLNLNK